jgi:hypothetical protein
MPLTKLNGLVAMPELNGRAGTAVKFDEGQGRYDVELDLSQRVDQVSSSFMIKPGNLCPTAEERAINAAGNRGVREETWEEGLRHSVYLLCQYKRYSVYLLCCRSVGGD